MASGPLSMLMVDKAPAVVVLVASTLTDCQCLTGQPVNVLRALIRTHDLDSTRRTVKWKEGEKLAAFIAEGMRARLARGSSFIGRGQPW